MMKRQNKQKKLINELKKQLFTQAERLGIRDQYSPLALEELSLEALGRILGDFYTERANLEYELNVVGSNKKEILIKMERLNVYIRKAEGLRQKHFGAVTKLIEKGQGDKHLIGLALRKLRPLRIAVSA